MDWKDILNFYQPLNKMITIKHLALHLLIFTEDYIFFASYS